MILAGDSEVFLCVLALKRILLRSGTREIFLNIFFIFITFSYFLPRVNEVWVTREIDEATGLGASALFADPGISLHVIRRVPGCFLTGLISPFFFLPGTVFQMPYKIDLVFRFW